MNWVVTGVNFLSLRMMRSISWLLVVCLLGLIGCGEGTKEQKKKQKVERPISELQHKNPKVRADAAGELSLTGEEAEDAVVALTQALQDPDPEGRADAAEALSLTGGEAEDAVVALIQALQDPEGPADVAGALEDIGLEDIVLTFPQILRTSRNISILRK